MFGKRVERIIPSASWPGRGLFRHRSPTFTCNSHLLELTSFCTIRDLVLAAIMYFTFFFAVLASFAVAQQTDFKAGTGIRSLWACATDEPEAVDTRLLTRS